MKHKREWKIACGLVCWKFRGSPIMSAYAEHCVVGEQAMHVLVFRILFCMQLSSLIRYHL